jgi:cation/acetate symporter
MTSGALDVTNSNMAAPLLARSMNEWLFAVISAIAFTTVLGTVSGLILASAGAMVLGKVLASRVFELSVGFDPWLWVIGMTAGVAIVGVTGVLATRRVVNHPPVEALRTF